jgi:hypothetical protein
LRIQLKLEKNIMKKWLKRVNKNLLDAIIATKYDKEAFDEGSRIITIMYDDNLENQIRAYDKLFVDCEHKRKAILTKKELRVVGFKKFLYAITLSIYRLFYGKQERRDTLKQKVFKYTHEINVLQKRYSTLPSHIFVNLRRDIVQEYIKALDGLKK